MSEIDELKKKVEAKDYFNHDSGRTYVRLLDTPHIWGEPFSSAIMEKARKRTKEFEKAVIEVIGGARHRCDIASLNCPDPDWTKIILNAMDIAMRSKTISIKEPPQFRFLFGQTPMVIKDGAARYVDFQGALIRLVRERVQSRAWPVAPEIWISKFSRLGKGIEAGLVAKVNTGFAYVSNTIAEALGYKTPEDDEESTKMTWNHAKIIAADGLEALVGGHNLNMDLFTSYPPVHDVSVVVHGEAALGAQHFLTRMWDCNDDLLVKEYLDSETWRFRDGFAKDARPLRDPFAEAPVKAYVKNCQDELFEIHESVRVERVKAPKQKPEALASIKAEDLQTLEDLALPLFKEKARGDYEKLDDYREATRVFSVGKYWTGPNPKEHYQKASELMKEQLIKGAKKTLYFSQMDLVSAWKKQWDSHKVCDWIMAALRANPALTVKVVVSPLDAGAGAEGDQYSFGSGAQRTFDLIEYYTTYRVDDQRHVDAAEREKSLSRLHIAPFFYTQVAPDFAIEGETYKWPGLPEKGRTASLREPSLEKRPPRNGVIGSAVKAVFKAGLGEKLPYTFEQFKRVDSAPGNHAKITIVDEKLYVVGSDNLYPGFLSEFNYLIEGEAAVGELLTSYWNRLWAYSGQHCVNPLCKGGCVTLPQSQSSPLSAPWSSLAASGLGLGGVSPRASLGGGLKGLGATGLLSGVTAAYPGIGSATDGNGKSGPGGSRSGVVAPSAPLLNPRNRGRVVRVEVAAQAEDLGRLEREHEQRCREDTAARAAKSPPPSTSSSAAKKEKGGSSRDDERVADVKGDHYYTDRDIFRLLEHYVGRAPNVIVRPCFQADSLRRLPPNCFDGLGPLVPQRGKPMTIIQPYNVRLNHWGLIYIKVVEPNRQARVLYIDPLSPTQVPDLAPLRRAFPALDVERSTERFQNDGDAQHSCGAWIVDLAQRLVLSDDVLPPVEGSPRAAAQALRRTHQAILDSLGPDPLIGR